MKGWFLFICTTVMLLYKTDVSYGSPTKPAARVKTGAEQTDKYLPMLKGKKVALLINQTSVIDKISLLDKLIENDINIVKIFVPEHGFRGAADAGAHVENTTDKKTGLPVISLYGNNKKPSAEQLKDLDIVIYDLQDVGVRFYTYISTLQYMMEACADNHKKLLILDRPNPNGNYVDGPVLNKDLKSFVGMQAIPVVYGMTAGEYAGMLIGEKWLGTKVKPDIEVVKCENYTHKTAYELPIPPSPNLKTMAAIYLYPSLCLFEGTVISVGRGTDKPFQQWGHPELKGKYEYSFTPISMGGAGKPLYEGKECYGELVANNYYDALKKTMAGLSLSWLIQAYKDYPKKDKFFSDFFDKLAGTKELRKQVESGMSEVEIKATWKKDINEFKKIRQKYLLYTDF